MTAPLSFRAHPAFRRGVDRDVQRKALSAIHAALPPEQSRVAAWVNTAMLDRDAVMSAMRALDEMPEALRRSVFVQSRAAA